MTLPLPVPVPSSTASSSPSTSSVSVGETSGHMAFISTNRFGLARKKSLKLQHHHCSFSEDLPDAEDAPTKIIYSDLLTSTSFHDTSCNTMSQSSERHPPLRYTFSGYSIWLELEQRDIDIITGRGDLDRAMLDAADYFNLGGAIPSPHVTALYGIDTIVDEDEIRRRFREDVKRLLLNEVERRKQRLSMEERDGVDGQVEKLWPDLVSTGIIVDVEFDGVNGGRMDMAWAEVSFATTPEHETLIETLHELFYRPLANSTNLEADSYHAGEEKKEEYPSRSQLWAPHLSFCYDNPEGLGHHLSRSSFEQFLKEKCPTLFESENDGNVGFSRAVTGFSLWKTAGTMAEWRCLDRLTFDSVATYLSRERLKTEELAEDSEDSDTGLSENQNRLLYLIDIHTKKAQSREGSDRWIRKQALSVLIYEGILAGVFNYDYSPQSTQIENKRVWVNVSQEGQSDVELLREENLISALLVSSKSYKPVVLYQVTDKGQDLLKSLARKEKEAVNAFAHEPNSQELLKTSWDGESYWLGSYSGYKRRSTATDTEDVSYVSSPYIPLCLRYDGRPTITNAHRSHESAQVGIDNIRDNNVEEIITLNSVSVIIAEYIPFGSNQIVQLNQNVGSSERVQGGFISNVIDGDSSRTSLELSPELTSVEVLDYTPTNHINFEAEIRFREDPGIVQVETFGVSMNAEGACFYGMQLESVMNRIKDNISLDHLSRILVDIQQDSSSIVDTVISQHQRDLLDLVFIGDASNRNKINLIIANEITPHLTAGEYMDRGDYENEFNQVIGDTREAFDISEEDTLIFGSRGLLVCGPYARKYEPLLCAYLQFITLDLFLQNFFSRVWILNDDLKTSYQIAETIDYDPLAMGRSRDRLCTHSNEIIMSDQILAHLEEALDMMEIPPEPPEQAGRSLYQRLEITVMREQLLRRVKDLKKNLIATQRNLDLLRERIEVESHTKSLQMSLDLEKNTKNLCSLQIYSGEALRSLKVLQLIFVGVLSFDFLDRITGEWTVLDTDWMTGFVESVFKKHKMVWFVISMIVWLIAAVFMLRWTFIADWKGRGMTTLSVVINRKINIIKLKELILAKEKITEDRKYEDKKRMVTIAYNEPNPAEWGGTSPFVTLKYDDEHRFFLEISIQYNRREARLNSALTADELKQKIMHEFENKGVFRSETDDHAASLLAMARVSTVDLEKKKRSILHRSRAVRFDESTKSNSKEPLLPR